MRTRTIYNSQGEKIAEYQGDELIWAAEYHGEAEKRSHMIMPDIQPYISQIDGRLITSRSVHRKHLREHGCIEVGNEKMEPKRLQPAPGLKETIIRSFDEHTRR